jgi:hypothetical protein
MSRYADLDALRRNISPDVRIVDDVQPPAYRLTPAKVTVYVPTEHDEQVALFAWAAAQEETEPALRNLVSFPNGGYRPMATAAKLKQEGVKAGLPDMALFCKRGGYGALFIELKRADRSNGCTPEQSDWIDRLHNYGYMAAVCYGAQEAIDAITDYLSLNERSL